MIIEEINISSNEYPQNLRNIFNPPEILYCLGNLDLLKEEKILAVVGTRMMSEYGTKVIDKLIPEIVNQGYVVVSGMAYGVDACVQYKVIENGGKTIAVLATGADEPSPKGNKWLYEKIIESGGLIVSENKSGYKVDKKDFLKRNRIIAGLSKGILVIEADIHSGSLATARMGLEWGREVMAVPGRIDSGTSSGCNWLIKNGARLVEVVEDLDEGVIIKG